MESIIVYTSISMSEKFVIQWKSKVNGRAGRGTKLFDRDEGEQLIQELNREYPSIDHELVKPQGEGSGSGEAEHKSTPDQEHIVSTE